MPNVKHYPKKVDEQIAIISSLTNISEAIKCHGCTLIALVIPNDFDGAQIEFEVSIDSGNSFQKLYDKDNVAIQYAVSANRAYNVDYPVFAGVDEIKIISDTNETATREILIKMIP